MKTEREIISKNVYVCVGSGCICVCKSARFWETVDE